MSWIDQDAHDPLATATVDSARFREAMSRLGAAVHVVTTAGPAGRAGFTATAVCSVSDDPATLLVCLARKSRITPVLAGNGVFCVNTLRADAEALADVFAGRTGAVMDERFAAGQWTTLTTGSPVLASAVVALDCRIVEVKAVATHNVLFAAVEAVHEGPAGPALVYHERAYKQV